MAIDADNAKVIGLVPVDEIKLTLVGVAIVCTCVYSVIWIKAFDGVIYRVALIILLIICSLASWLPAWHASAIASIDWLKQ